MVRPRSRTVWFAVWFGLVLFSVRPVGPVEEAVAWAVSPLRLLPELTSPLRLARSAPVRRTEDELARRAEDEARENRRLVEDLARHALPTDPALLGRCRPVHAEVAHRVRGNRDRLVVTLADPRGVVPGLPAASGNAYVGRVARLLPRVPGRPQQAEVELVTARGFHVGARVAGGGQDGILMTVGGVETGRAFARGIDSRVLLAVQNPSDRELSGGTALVDELFDDAEPLAHLAQGLRLGHVLPADEAEETGWAIEPEIDYVDGLYQLVVLCPPDPGLPPPPPRRLALDDGNWVSARPLGAGDASPWRETIQVAVGRVHGVRPGAAVTAIGARLLGRVTRASAWSSHVSFLGDPGFSVVAVARIEDIDEPLVLGRLVSEGRAEDGSVRMRWIPRVALHLPAVDDSGMRRARLFTGSGDQGLATGFFLGEALLPIEGDERGAREVRLFSDVDPLDVRRLFCRVQPAGPAEPGR